MHALLDALSSEEMREILAKRLDSADRTELLDMLGGATQAASDRAGGNLSSNEAARVQVFEAVSPSVAAISTALDQPNSMWNGMPVGAGSGFVYDVTDEDVWVVTNYHVVAGGRAPRPGLSGSKLPRKVQVKLHGHEESVDARVVGYEADKDLAVLRVDPRALSSPLVPVQLASSADLKVGQTVLALGAPFGLDRTLTQGIVSALGRDIAGAGGRPIRDCVQTDAAINPGNSGGPLLDSSGRVVGVNTMIFAPNGIGGNIGIGFAVPSDTVSRVVSQIIAHGPNARPSLGVSVLPDQLRRQYAHLLRRDLQGALIAQVVPGGPAEALALRPSGPDQRGRVRLGDMITSVNGLPIKRNEDLLCLVEEAEAGEPLALTLMRECDPDRLEEVTITPVRRQALMEGFGALEQRVASERTQTGLHQRMQRDW